MLSSNVCISSSITLIISPSPRVQNSLQSLAHSRSLQTFATFHSSANRLLHHRPATNGQGRSHGCFSEPCCRGFYAEADGSQACQYESQVDRTQVQLAQPLSAWTFKTSATNRQSLTFDSSSSFLSPADANIAGNPSDAAATLAQQRAKLNAANNAAHRTSIPALATSTALGLVSLHSAKLRSATTPPHKTHGSNPGHPDHRLFWPFRQPCVPPFSPRCRYRTRQTIPHHGRQLGEYGEHPAPSHIPEVVDG